MDKLPYQLLQYDICLTFWFSKSFRHYCFLGRILDGVMNTTLVLPSQTLRCDWWRLWQEWSKMLKHAHPKGSLHASQVANLRWRKNDHAWNDKKTKTQFRVNVIYIFLRVCSPISCLIPEEEVAWHAMEHQRPFEFSSEIKVHACVISVLRRGQNHEINNGIKTRFFYLNGISNVFRTSVSCIRRF